MVAGTASTTHDDIANAVAGVLVHVTNKGAPMVITPEILAQVRAAPPVWSKYGPKY